jgi:hypothetical protein
MKTNKILVSAVFVTSCLFVAPAMAQTDGSAEATSTESTEQSTTDPNADPNTNYNERVTIDEESATTEETSTESGSASTQSRSSERIRIYSGKHDGNNVIYDPK